MPPRGDLKGEVDEPEAVRLPALERETCATRGIFPTDFEMRYVV